MTRRVRSLVGTAALALALAACGGAASGGSGDPSLTITSPADDAAVDGSFTLEWDSSEQLGAPETGRDHVHVFVDGHEDDYTVVGRNEFDITGLSPGDHTVGITLQHADHSPAGAEAAISVHVTSAGTDGGGGAPPGGGYDY